MRPRTCRDCDWSEGLTGSTCSHCISSLVGQIERRDFVIQVLVALLALWLIVTIAGEKPPPDLAPSAAQSTGPFEPASP